MTRRECDVHSEYNASTEDQAAQTWERTRPKGQEPFFLEDFGGTLEAILVKTPGFYRLHANGKFSIDSIVCAS